MFANLLKKTLLEDSDSVEPNSVFLAVSHNVPYGIAKVMVSGFFGVILSQKSLLVL